jgi:hypothetical protein
MTKAERTAVQNDMVTLREYMEALLYSQKMYFETRLNAMEDAQAKFEQFNTAKLGTMNEIREQLGTQKADFLTRVEFEGKHELVCQKVESLQKFMWGIGGGVVLLELILRFIK